MQSITIPETMRDNVPAGASRDVEKVGGFYDLYLLRRGQMVSIVQDNEYGGGRVNNVEIGEVGKSDRAELEILTSRGVSVQYIFHRGSSRVIQSPNIFGVKRKEITLGEIE